MNKTNGYIIHQAGQLSRGAVLDVGLKCVHSCKFCYYSYLDGSDNQFSGMRNARFRTKEECFSILKKLKENGFINFDITGGEPTIHNDIVDIIRYAEQELGLNGRIITLGQFLTQRNPHLENHFLIDELLKAGLTNFLFSIHAVDEELFKRSTGGSWEKLRAALDYLDNKEFYYTSNTTVYEWNYEKLPEIAREILKHNIYAHNFIIMNAYYEWNQGGKAFGTQAKYSKIYPYLKEAVDILEAGKVAVNIRYAPLCAVKGMERNLVGVVGVRYDPYEWMNNGGHFGGNPEYCAGKLALKEGEIEDHVKYCDAIGELDNKTIITGRRGDNLKMFAGSCANCGAKSVCDGIDYNYLNLYGDSEFNKYTDVNISPIQKERLEYLPAFAIKTGQFTNMKQVVAELFDKIKQNNDNRPSGANTQISSEIETNDSPLVSVVIPCYNYGEYLAGAVESVINQTYKNIEIIIVNDGSPDNTKEVAEKLIAEYPNRRITLINQENSGQPAISRNNGIKIAVGKYILPLDADDEIAPLMIQTCVDILESNTEYAIAYVDNEYFGDDEKIEQAGAPFELEKLKEGNFIAYCSLYRHEVWEKAKGYRTNVPGYEDWDFWIEAAKNGFKGVRIAKPLFRYRIHQGLLSKTKRYDEINRANIVLNREEIYSTDETKRAKKVLSLYNNSDDSLEDYLDKIFERLQNLNLNGAETLSAAMVCKYFDNPESHEIRAGILRLQGKFRAAHAEALIAFATHKTLNSILEMYLIFKKAGANDKAEKIRTSFVKNKEISQESLDNLSLIQMPVFYLLSDDYLAQVRDRELAKEQDDSKDFTDSPINNNANLTEQIPSDDANKFVNICSVTFNRLEYTKQMIDGVIQHTTFPYVLTVVDNNSQDGTKEYLSALKEKGIIKNLILLDENLGVAPAANIGWLAEPDAEYYLKLDNDIVIQKDNWLEELVLAIDSIPKLGAVGYNFENKSYPLFFRFGVKIRPKRYANIGGACYLIPKRIEREIGYWCEDYSPYGEEDGDYSLRLRNAGYYNAYLEDEDIGLHLPGGKAAEIDPITIEAIDPKERESEKEYREWKDYQRNKIKQKDGLLHRNILMYQENKRTLFVPPGKLLGILDGKIQIFHSLHKIIFLALDEINIEDYRETIGNWLKINELDHLELRKLEYFNRTAYYLESKPKENEMEEQIKVSIIIPTFNRADLTAKCLKSIYQLAKPNASFETIIIDNSSTDNSSDIIKEWAQKENTFHFAINDSNLGFAKACNIGAVMAKGEYLMFLNNDTIPLDGWLDNLLASFDNNPNIGAVGSKLLYPTGKIQHAGIEFNENGLPYHVYRNYDKRQDEVRFEKYYPAVTGASIMLSKNVFNKIKGFDESYSMYVEDVDLCLKLWDAGYKVMYQPASELIHLESASITDLERRDEMVRAGWTKLLIKWHNKFDSIRELVNNANNKNTVLPLETIPTIPSVEIITPQEVPMKPINYCAPIYDPSGYADDARNLINQLLKLGAPIHISPIGRHSDTFKSECAPKMRSRLDAAMENTTPTSDFINIIHFPAYTFDRIDSALYNIGRLVFETDSMPQQWVEKCNQMDEIWTATDFNVETFKNAGVKANIYKVPEGVNSDKFHPYVEPLRIQGAKGFVFLSIFEWTYRKGWDILLESWIKAFKATDNVSLVLRTYLPNAIDKSDSSVEINQIIDNFLLDNFGLNRDEVAPIIVLGSEIPDGDMPRLYASANAYVSPTRGEGWGRPMIEAMACGLPTIATNWGGLKEFMNAENSYQIELDGLEKIDEKMEWNFYRGQSWAYPSELSLVQIMRHINHNQAEARYKGLLAREYVKTNFSWEIAAKCAMDRLQDISDGKVKKREIIKPASPALGEFSDEKKRINIVWEGSQMVFHSLALVNRELCSKIIESGVAELTIIPYEADQFLHGDSEKFKKLQECDIRLKKEVPKEISSLPYVWVRHQWPPKAEPPKGAKWIVMQPWEYSEHRADFMPIFKGADEVWTPSNHSRDSFVRAGLDFNKAQIVPNGVNPDLFTPVGEKTELPTKKSLKLLYVGGTIYRKGIDILLNAYTKIFSAEDDICLVIKDMGGDSFYKGQTAEERIKQIRENPNSPEILYAAGNMAEDEMPKLYRACDIFVSPYRAEGFSLPTLEAMACGLPVIVTENGATDDFVDEEVGWKIPSRKVFIGDNFDGKPLTGNAFVYEADSDELGAMLAELYDDRRIAFHKGVMAQRRARKDWNWRNAAIKLFSRLDAMLGLDLAINAEKTLPPFEDVYTIFGDAEYEYCRGNIDYAIELFSSVIRNFDLKDEYRQYLYNRFATLSIAGMDMETAQEFVDYALRIKPNNPDSIYLKARIQSYSGNYETALETIAPLLDNWMTIKNEIQTELHLDNILCAAADNWLNLEDFNSALEIYEKALEIYDENADACFGAGVCLYNLEAFEDAEKMWRWALKIAPDYSAAIEALNLIDN